ncbi:DMT family transporter [Caenispirillum bisanense]|uniref:Permease of the drug/metabolite transporter (DMT) superfamily n=1 Tax=Caenispirillum bisanense TaxID=414052 RepID=A0A286GP50_9PROT|nr:DMT family transporter [Caenispirillum bisanense]SOD96744.1 Permease of the drug/metabolite transporter (DMT) superfamily [Caenispirillum bisanense]
MTARTAAAGLPATEAGGTALKVLLILTISLFWGGNWPAVKTVLFEMPPLTLRAIGFATGAIGLLAWARFRGLRLRIPMAEVPWMAATGMLNIFAFNMCTVYAQLMMPTSRAAIIAFTMPVWATLLAIPLLGERPGLRQVIGLALGMSGLLVLLGPEAVRGEAGPLLGPALVLGAAVSWALGTVLMKRRGLWVGHAVVVTGWQYVLAAVPMVVLAGVLDGPPRPGEWGLRTWTALGYHLIFSICIAQMMWFLIVKRLTVGQAAVATLLVPVVGVSGSVLILGDALTVRLVAALGLVVSAVACVMIRRRTAR